MDNNSKCRQIFTVQLRLLFGFFLASSVLYASIGLPDNFKSDFKQMVSNAKGKKITYTGKVYFSNKKLFKWVYLKPTKKEVCTNSRELIVVDHDLEQVSTFYVERGLNVGKILKKAKHYKKHIYLANFNDKKYTIKIDAAGKLQSIAYYDNMDNKVQILFKQMKYGKGELSQEELQCRYPKMYDMIKG